MMGIQLAWVACHLLVLAVVVVWGECEEQMALAGAAAGKCSRERG